MGASICGWRHGRARAPMVQIDQLSPPSGSARGQQIVCSAIKMKSRDRREPDRKSAEPADLFLGHHALDLLSLALDAVTGAAVSLDRQAADDGIDAALGGGGAALRSLDLVMDVIVNSVNMRH